MADYKKFDLTVFGATGFTGKYVLQNLINCDTNLTIAAAGRSRDKLATAVAEAVKHSKVVSASIIEIIIADAHDQDSLKSMAESSKVVLNCVGPYRFYGEAVVNACIENKCHYVDISGEPEFLEKMEYLYHKSALDMGVYVIGACGFDSIPSDIGVLHLKQQFAERNGKLDFAEGFLQFDVGSSGTKVNYGTWQTLIHSVANSDNLKVMRKEYSPGDVCKDVPRPPKRGAFFRSPFSNKWSVPFLGADVSVVKRSQYSLKQLHNDPPSRFFAYLSFPSFAYASLTAVLWVLFSFIVKFSFGRQLLLRYPECFTCGLFSRTGPSRKQIEGTSFSWHFFGTGTDSDGAVMKLDTIVTGPEPGYVTTPISMVQTAFVLLDGKGLSSTGGVYPAGAALSKTNIIERLTNSGIRFSLAKEY